MKVCGESSGMRLDGGQGNFLAERQLICPICFEKAWERGLNQRLDQIRTAHSEVIE